MTFDFELSPLNFTPPGLGTPAKLIPSIRIWSPGAAKVGSNPVTIGARVTMKSFELTPGPRELLTVIGPLVAPGGTVTLIWFCAVKPHPDTDAPAKLIPVTLLVGPRFRPSMVTCV